MTDPTTITWRAHEPLAPFTSWRIGGPARRFTVVHDPAALQLAVAQADALGLRWFILGGGSNLLIPDHGWSGAVIRYRDRRCEIERHGDAGLALIGAGAPMAGTARRLAHLGWAGLEWAEGLPGTIGGAVFGNAGCYGGDIAGTLEYATLLVGGVTERWSAARLAYGYRTSALKRHAGDAPRPVILGAALRLQHSDPVELARRMELTASLRRSRTPWGASCGSVFKNPPGESAGRLIEAVGLKSSRSGQAMIAPEHANYIINLGQASSDDVLRLIDQARERVLSHFGITLELEVQLL
jgi:UDP-N-acetylmuramate dehydrogenase